MRTLLTLTLLVLLAVSFTGCQRGSAATPKQVEVEAASPQAAKDVHYCKGITAKGERCKRHVKAEGEYCWQHVIQANPCWRPKGSQPKQDCYYQDGDVTRPIPGKP